MNLKSFTLEITGVVIDEDDKKVVVAHKLVYSARAPAIHDAIERMGVSFNYGLGTALSREMLGLLEYKKDSAK